MKRTALPCLLACLALAAGLTGCGRGSSGGEVAFVTNNPAEFWSYAEAGAKKAEKDFDVKCQFRRPPTGTAAEQKQIIDALLAKGVKAIAVSVRDPDNQTDYLKEIAAKVPLITQDNDAPGSGRLCYIGTDNYKAGRAVGKLVKLAMPLGGKVAIFVGQSEPLNARERRQGVLDELAGQQDAGGTLYGKYELIGSGGTAPFTDNLDGKLAKKNADDVLTKYPDDDNLCLIGLWAYNPPAIYKAVKAAGREGRVKIVGFDEDEGTLDGIQAGHIFGTVVQQPFQFGYEAVKLMSQLAKGDKSGLPEDGVMYIPHKVIVNRELELPEETVVQVGEFRDYLADLLKK